MLILGAINIINNNLFIWDRFQNIDLIIFLLKQRRSNLLSAWGENKQVVVLHRRLLKKELMVFLVVLSLCPIFLFL